MSDKNKILKLNFGLESSWRVFALMAFFIGAALFSVAVTPAYAQYIGGNETTDPAQSSIGSNIYNGGSQNNLSFATTGSAGTLAYGSPTQLVFTVSPADTNHSFPFNRQPVVAIEDAYGDVVADDNTDQVTVAILNNPGAGTLRGTKTITVVNGLAQFSGLTINASGQMYTLQATSGTLTPGVSAPFTINPGTGPQISAVWDNTTGASGYWIYTWAVSDNEKEPFNTSDYVTFHSSRLSGDVCTFQIFANSSSITPVECDELNGGHFYLNCTAGASVIMNPDYTNNWCKSAGVWNPGASALANSYVANVQIYGQTPCPEGTSGNPCVGTLPLPLSGSGTVISDSFGNTINWSDIKP